MEIILKPVGYIRTEAKEIPRHWTVSEVEGRIVINEEYREGIRDIKSGDRIVVIFHFHKSPEFNPPSLVQKPPHRDRKFGVFSTCSPLRPNPIGMSVLDVLDVKDNIIYVKGIDMFDGTPVLDIKPDIRKD
jgi:tRNA-Thr(GGU) m(6)t(6)A37 methyltransferase TsaA